MSHHRFIVGHVLDALKTLPDESIHCIVTSPPYWGLRTYDLPPVTWPEVEYFLVPGLPPLRVPAWRGQLGLEPTPEMYVGHLVLVFREVWRVLRRDGTLWLNLGDSYNGSGGAGGDYLPGGWKEGQPKYPGRNARTLKPKDLAGIPWRVAFALQADGWWLRSDVVWCLSGGTWVYARTPKVEGPVMLKDLARMDHRQVELWNGVRWVRLLGMSKSHRNGEEIEIVLRSGERISCTLNHKFPTERGLLEAKDIRVGDRLLRCQLPEPRDPLDSSSILDEDAAWLAGFYIANGSRSGRAIQLSTHKDKVWIAERLERIAGKFGGSSARFVYGNKLVVHLYGKLLHALLDELVSGDTAKNKRFSPKVWRFSNKCLEAALDGYLAGDGFFDERNNRWRLGFCRNYELERDLRTLCARLGYVLTLKQAFTRYQDKKIPVFRGEIRKTRSSCWNEQSREEVIEIRKARCREVYDLGVSDPTHLFALASGILTHNSKPNPLPESVKDRPTRSHEYVFLLAKSERYFYDAEAVKEPLLHPGATGTYGTKHVHAQNPQYSHSGRPYTPPAGGRNRRSVWEVNTEPFSGAHFAVFPRRLAEICILAGTSPRACPACGAPWQRIIRSAEVLKNAYLDRAKMQPGNTSETSWLRIPGSRRHLISPPQTLGWRPSCPCGAPPGVEPDDLEVIWSPTGGGANEDPTLYTGRAGLNRPRGPDEGVRPMTRYEQRKYAEQLRNSPYRELMEAEAGSAFAHYIRTDRSGARPVPPDLLERWIERGWLARVEVPVWTPPEPVPCVVLDPFGGAGTTTLAAIGLGRDSIYIDLKREYAEMALERCGFREGVQRRLFCSEEWLLEEVGPSS